MFMCVTCIIIIIFFLLLSIHWLKANSVMSVVANYVNRIWWKMSQWRSKHWNKVRLRKHGSISCPKRALWDNSTMKMLFIWRYDLPFLPLRWYACSFLGCGDQTSSDYDRHGIHGKWLSRCLSTRMNAMSSANRLNSLPWISFRPTKVINHWMPYNWPGCYVELRREWNIYLIWNMCIE